MPLSNAVKKKELSTFQPSWARLSAVAWPTTNTVPVERVLAENWALGIALERTTFAWAEVPQTLYEGRSEWRPEISSLADDEYLYDMAHCSSGEWDVLYFWDFGWTDYLFPGRMGSPCVSWCASGSPGHFDLKIVPENGSSWNESLWLLIAESQIEVRSLPRGAKVMSDEWRVRLQQRFGHDHGGNFRNWLSGPDWDVRDAHIHDWRLRREMNHQGSPWSFFLDGCSGFQDLHLPEPVVVTNDLQTTLPAIGLPDEFWPHPKGECRLIATEYID